MAENRFQRNKGDKIEGLIYCLSNFKVQMEYEKSRHSKVKQQEAVREAEDGFRFNSIIIVG